MRDFVFQWSQTPKLQCKEPLKDHNADSIVLFWLHIICFRHSDKLSIYEKAVKVTSCVSWETYLCRFPKRRSSTLVLVRYMPDIHFLQWVLGRCAANAHFPIILCCLLSSCNSKNRISFSSESSKLIDIKRRWQSKSAWSTSHNLFHFKKPTFVHHKSFSN